MLMRCRWVDGYERDRAHRRDSLTMAVKRGSFSNSESVGTLVGHLLIGTLSSARRVACRFGSART